MIYAPILARGKHVEVKSLSRARLCSLPGSSFYGRGEARVLEWVAISFSRFLPDPGIKPGSPALHADALTSEPPGEPRKACSHS